MMKEQDVEKMFEILSKKEKSSRDEMEYFRNNLDGFQKWMLNTATHALTSAGMPQELADGMLIPLIEITKMCGANEYHDFVNVAHMFKEGGLS